MLPRRSITIRAIDDYQAVLARRERSWSIAVFLLLATLPNLEVLSDMGAYVAADRGFEGIFVVSVSLLMLFATISVIVSAGKLSISHTDAEPLRRVTRYADIPDRWKGLYPFLW